MNARSGHEEFERVLRAMRDRLASVSHEISELLGRLEWHVETASPDIRLHARTAAADVVRTQEWLNHRLHALPQDPSQRYAAMQDMLQVQFVALQKISTIVNDVLSLRSRAPGSFQPALPSPQSLFPSPQLAPPAQPGAYAMTPAQQHQQLRFEHAVDLAWDDQPAMEGMLQPAPAPRRLSDLSPPDDVPRTISRARAQTASRRNGDGNRSANDRERSGGRSNRRLIVWTGALLAAIVLVGGAGYAAYSTLVGSNSTTASRSAGKKERVSFGDPSAREQALANAQVHSGPVRVPSAPPMAAPPLDDQGRRAVPGMMVAAPQSPRPDPRAQPFVAVIATHRDKQALTKIYNDLRKQYPGVLGPRRADAQTVNLGEGGVWHHLVLLPPGPREQAEASCTELRAAGYSRCMVRPF